MATHYTVRIDTSAMPGMLYGMRRSLADLLRKEAEGEPEFVATKLQAIAAAFETGIDPGDEDA